MLWFCSFGHLKRWFNFSSVLPNRSILLKFLCMVQSYIFCVLRNFYFTCYFLNGVLSWGSPSNRNKERWGRRKCRCPWGVGVWCRGPKHVRRLAMDQREVPGGRTSIVQQDSSCLFGLPWEPKAFLCLQSDKKQGEKSKSTDIHVSVTTIYKARGICQVLLSPHKPNDIYYSSHPLEVVLLSLTFYRWRHWSLETLHKCPQISHLQNSRGRTGCLEICD